MNRYENRQRIGRRLAAVREGQGWTQEQLAAMADMRVQTVQKIESGQFRVDVDVLEVLCDVLGVRVDIVEGQTNK